MRSHDEVRYIGSQEWWGLVACRAAMAQSRALDSPSGAWVVSLAELLATTLF